MAHIASKKHGQLIYTLPRPSVLSALVWVTLAAYFGKAHGARPEIIEPHYYPVSMDKAAYMQHLRDHGKVQDRTLDASAQQLSSHKLKQISENPPSDPHPVEGKWFTPARSQEQELKWAAQNVRDSAKYMQYEAKSVVEKLAGQEEATEEMASRLKDADAARIKLHHKVLAELQQSDYVRLQPLEKAMAGENMAYPLEEYKKMLASEPQIAAEASIVPERSE